MSAHRGNLRRRALRVGALALLGLAACREELLDGLWPAPANEGPAVLFDLLARPLPEIPFPIDIATRLDTDSPTGRRVNASLVAPTLLENEVRDEFNRLDGWGTFAAMTVSFTAEVNPVAIRDAHLNDDFGDDAVYVINLKTGEPARLDLGRGNFPVILQNNDKYFENDARSQSSNMLFETYAEDCIPGLPPPLEKDTDHDGVCDRPNTLDPTKPHSGWPSADPALNLAPVDPALRGNDQYRDLMVHYERQSNTLIIRPVVPLDERTTYAVVLTDRIRDAEGRAIRSPFSFVNHAAQTEQLRPLEKIVASGKIPGLARDNVVFAWAFTTQSVTTDLVQIREGLYGNGPLAELARRVSEKLEPVQYYDAALDEDAADIDYLPKLEPHPLHPLKDSAGAGDSVYIVRMAEFVETFRKIVTELGVDAGPQADALVDTYRYVDYFVVGSFQTPNFMDDPEKPSFDSVFRVSPEHGLFRLWQRPPGWEDVELRAQKASATFGPDREAAAARLRQAAKRAVRDRVWFFLTVPKAQPERTWTDASGQVRVEPALTAPFPVALYGHGYTSNRPEFLGFAGSLAKYGVASVGVDSYGHGLDLSQAERQAIVPVLGKKFGPLTRSLFQGRARDLDNDGVDNSGGDFWVADTFHTRDVVRQTIVDWVQLVRVFKAFGTYEMGDVNGDGTPELAGDFNGDGVPDVGGPEYPAWEAWPQGKRNGGADFFAWGQSLGGFISGIVPAVEPSVVAAAPSAGGAGLSDVGIRSEQGGVIQAVFLEVLGPILAGLPADAERVCGRAPVLPDGSEGVHLWYVLQDVNAETCLRLTDTPLDIRPGDVVRGFNLNLDSDIEDKSDTAVVDANRRFRLQVPADNASFLDDAEVGEAPVRLGRCDPQAAKVGENGLRHLADCIRIQVFRDGKEVLTFDRFGQEIYKLNREDQPGGGRAWVARPASFQQRRFEPGSPLVAPARGFAHKRGSPSFRRFMSLAQTILEPADPGNYSKIMNGPGKARGARDAALMVIATTGDLNVPVNTAYAQARAANLVPYVYDPAKHAAWGMSPNDVLIRTHAMESIEKLRYFTPVAAKMREPNAPVHPLHEDLVRLVQCEAPEHCEATTLVDLSSYGRDPNGVYLDSGRRDHRYGGAPRLKQPLRDAVTLVHPGLDRDGNAVEIRSALVTPYLDTHGRHGFDTPNPYERVGGVYVANPFDVDTYMINMIGRYFQTRGAELPYETCMHRDGWDRPRLKEDGTVDAAAKRDPACGFIPTPPTTY